MTFDKKAYQRELMRKRRAEKKDLGLGGEEPTSESTVPRTEMKGSDRHPVYPQLKRWADREYDENGLVLKEQRCELCNRTWSASVKIECPYCHGKGIKTL